MGEAKRRAAARQAWLQSLTEDEQVITNASERLFLKFIAPSGATGMCYRMTFFLHLYLAEKGIETVPVVGYVNDGTDDIAISHAWLEYRDRKIDLTLAQVEHPDVTPPGRVLMLDYVYKNGHAYFYSQEKDARAVEAERGIAARSPDAAALVARKSREHADMKARTECPNAMRVFLDAAPDHLTYQAIAKIIDN